MRLSCARTRRALATFREPSTNRPKLVTASASPSIRPSSSAIDHRQRNTSRGSASNFAKRVSLQNSGLVLRIRAMSTRPEALLRRPSESVSQEACPISLVGLQVGGIEVVARDRRLPMRIGVDVAQDQATPRRCRSDREEAFVSAADDLPARRRAPSNGKALPLHLRRGLPAPAALARPAGMAGRLGPLQGGTALRLSPERSLYAIGDAFGKRIRPLRNSLRRYSDQISGLSDRLRRAEGPDGKCLVHPRIKAHFTCLLQAHFPRM